MKFHTQNYYDDHATVRRSGSYPDGSTKLEVTGRYGGVLCVPTVCLRDIGEEPAPGCVFIAEYGTTAGSLVALQDAGVVGRTRRIIETSIHTRDPLARRPVHEVPLLTT